MAKAKGKSEEQKTAAFDSYFYLLLFAFCVLTCAASTLAASLPGEERRAPAKLTYTRVLKGSVPEYIWVSVDSTGAGNYEGRKLDDAPSPRPLKLSAATTERLFDLASELNDFRSIELESHKKVANLGLKTFTYEEDSGPKNQVQFNYTLNRTAQDLMNLFEKIADVEQHVQALEYAIKYDPLGLPKELLQIQIDLENQALADPELMVPSLQEIARNPRFLHLAQVRAENILKTVNGDK